LFFTLALNGYRVAEGGGLKVRTVHKHQSLFFIRKFKLPRKPPLFGNPMLRAGVFILTLSARDFVTFSLRNPLYRLETSLLFRLEIHFIGSKLRYFFV
jgi:hypothetical protein